MPEVQNNKPSHTTNIALVKASHMAKPTSRAGEIYSASLKGGTAKSHAKDLGQEGAKNWDCQCNPLAAGGTDTFPTFWLYFKL